MSGLEKRETASGRVYLLDEKEATECGDLTTYKWEKKHDHEEKRGEGSILLKDVGTLKKRDG